MPVASTIAAVGAGIGAVTKGVGLVKSLTGGHGGGSAAAGGGAGVDFTGLMASPTSVANTVSSETLKSSSSFKDLASKFPENPAYQLALKADQIFVPEIKTV